MDWSKLARSHTSHEGQVTWKLLPFRSLRHDVIEEAVTVIVPREQWQAREQIFVYFETYVVGLDFTLMDNDAPSELRALALYWDSHSADVRANFALYCDLLTVGVLNIFWDAYNATRDPVFPASAALSEESAQSTDPLSVSNGSKPTRKSVTV